jgi:L-lactate dehydrogenase
MKVSVIGLGHVGATIAFSLVIKGLVDELVLVNRNQSRARGEAADLQHAAAFSTRKVSIRAGLVSDTRHSDIVVLCISHKSEGTTASPPSRDELAKQNTQLFRQWVPELVHASPYAIFVVVSNPVDVLSYVTWKSSQLPASRVIGTGTLIDSARYRSYLSEHLQIHPDDIRAYVLGEHGDTQFPALSVALTGGEKLDGSPDIEKFFQMTVSSGYEVYQTKGFTNYAIALSTCMILDAIIHNSNRTLPVSTLSDGFCSVSDVYLSIPCVVGREGIVRQLRPPMNMNEVLNFQKSANKIKGLLADLPALDTTPPFPPELR